MRRTFSFAVINTASFPTSDCPLFIDDPHLGSYHDLQNFYHNKLSLTSDKFGPPTTSFLYLGVYYNTKHPEITPTE